VSRIVEHVWVLCVLWICDCALQRESSSTSSAVLTDVNAIEDINSETSRDAWELQSKAVGVH
jgi:hypothetical protein